MKRRQILGLTACAAGLAGCLSGNRDDVDESALFDEGTAFISGFEAANGFSGTVRIVPSCREESVEIKITDGEQEDPIPYTREELGESCSFEMYVDSEPAGEFDISGARGSCQISIDEDGTIDPVPTCVSN